MSSAKSLTHKQWSDLMIYFLSADTKELETLLDKCEKCSCEDSHSNDPAMCEMILLHEDFVGLTNNERLAFKVFSFAQKCMATSQNGGVSFCGITINLQHVGEFNYLDALMCVDMFYTQNFPTQVRLWHETAEVNTSKSASKNGAILLSDGKSELILDKLAGGWIVRNCDSPIELHKVQKESAISRFNMAYISARFQETFRANNSFEFGNP